MKPGYSTTIINEILLPNKDMTLIAGQLDITVV